MKYKYILLLIILNTKLCIGQSVNQILNSKIRIKDKISALQSISGNKKLEYFFEYIIDSLASLTNDYELKSEAKRNLASRYQHSPQMAMSVAYDNLELSNQSKDCKLIVRAYLVLAQVNWFIRNDTNVFKFWKQALKEADKCKDKNTLTLVYEEGERYYFNTGQIEKCKNLTQKRAQLNPELFNDSKYYAAIGDIFREFAAKNSPPAIDLLDSADVYYLKAIKLEENNKNDFKIANLFSNYSLIPFYRGKHDLAIKYCKKALELAIKLKSKDLEYGVWRNLSTYYIVKGDYLNGKKYTEKIIEYLYISNMSDDVFEFKRQLAFVYSKLNDFKSAYNCLMESYGMYRILNNNQTNSELINFEQAYLKKQKQLEINLINQQKESETKIKNISILAICILLILIIGILYFLIKVQKSKKIITLQKIETEKQKQLLEEKQKEILDSISYANRLQEAILPPIQFVNTHLADNFIYYQPKDIVAGDFYWAEKVGDKFYIAAADSTGHGVPGAMVSVVCSNALNRTIKEFQLTETGKILDKTRDLVIETFEKSTNEVYDGMDISLLCIDSKNKNIYWSGANNPLWYIQNNTLIEIKPDKQPIGKSVHPKLFTTHHIEYKENTRFYLFTDGLADQFGGPNGKKFKYKQFSDLLIKNNNLPQKKQVEILNNAFKEWKGNLEQVDDVCVIGIKL